MTGSIDYQRISIEVPVDTVFDLRGLRVVGGGKRGFNRFVVWVLADWCRREKRRRRAWERRQGRKLGKQGGAP